MTFVLFITIKLGQMGNPNKKSGKSKKNSGKTEQKIDENQTKSG
jgi:hypothetical protein